MAVLNKRYTNRWQAQISYVLAKATGNVDNTGSAQVATRQFETPNLALVNADGPGQLHADARVQAAGQLSDPEDRDPGQRVLRGHERPALRSDPAVLEQHAEHDGLVVDLSSTQHHASRDAYYLPNLSQLDLRHREDLPGLQQPVRHLRGPAEHLQQGHGHERDHASNVGYVAGRARSSRCPSTRRRRFRLRARSASAGAGPSRASGSFRTARARSASSRRARALCTGKPFPRPPDRARITAWNAQPNRPAREAREIMELRRLKDEQPDLGSAADLQIQLFQLHRRVQSRVPLPA